jgi:hypothetical protein
MYVDLFDFVLCKRTRTRSTSSSRTPRTTSTRRPGAVNPTFIGARDASGPILSRQQDMETLISYCNKFQVILPLYSTFGHWVSVPSNHRGFICSHPIYHRVGSGEGPFSGDLNPESENLEEKRTRNSDRSKREYRLYRTWVKAGKWVVGVTPTGPRRLG